MTPSTRPVTVLHTIAGLHMGGAGRLLARLVAALDPDRIVSHVCSLVAGGPLQAEFEAAGVAPVVLHHRGSLSWPVTAARLWRLMRDLDVDIVHTNLWLDNTLARPVAQLAGLPVVTTLHNAVDPTVRRPGGPSTLSNRLRGRVEIWMHRHISNELVAVSTAVGDSYIRHVGIDPARIRVAPSGLPTGMFSSVEPDGTIRAELGLRPHDPLVLNVGRLRWEKGQMVLVAAMPEILELQPSAHLVIAGEGEERPRLEAAIRSHGLRGCVHLLGQRDDVPRLLAAADVFVFPSVSEGLPGALLEAMAAGKAVVASDIPAVREAITDGTSGVLVPPQTPGHLATAVADLLEDPSRRAALGRAARGAARASYSIQSTVRRLESIYGRLADPNRAQVIRGSRP